MDWEMLGHEWAVGLLSEHVARHRVRHAYLFVGPQGVGRRTLAIRLAQALNCLQPPAPGDACRRCRICKQLDRMQHVDLSIVQAEQVGGTLKVDQVRELQHSLALTPYEAAYRVALLLRFEEANHNAMNALLKTLEEPAPQVVLLVTAESVESLLPTIVSRCEVLRLRPPSLAQVSQGLQQRWNISEEQAELLAHISNGRPGLALNLSQQPERLEQRKDWLDEHWRLLAASRVDRFSFADNLAKDKEGLRSVLQVWLSFWRDILLRAVKSTAPVSNLDRIDEIELLAEKIRVPGITGFISALERTLDLIERNANTRLAAEVLLLDLPRYRG